MKVLLIVRTRSSKPVQSGGALEGSRNYLFEEALNADVLNADMLRQAPAWRRLFYRMVPETVAQAVEAAWIDRRYDVVISWGERYATLYGLLRLLSRSRAVHVAMLYWMSKGNVERPLRLARRRIDVIITWSSVQREYAVRHLSIPRDRIMLVHHPVDTEFWQGEESAGDMICSAGAENRDYQTLFLAMNDLSLRCHIATGGVRLIDRYSTRSHGSSTLTGEMPPNVTLGRCSPLELRALYARSRFVVVPLFPTDTDNGVTVILEAMAMGKPVICSRVEGQVDVLEEGRTGIFVPQGDPQALRDAIQDLWSQPEKAMAMGRAARQHVMQYHRIELFVSNVLEIVQDVVRRKTAR